VRPIVAAHRGNVEARNGPPLGGATIVVLLQVEQQAASEAEVGSEPGT
jgi:K+-sensing histidine kinase KdpD